MKQYLLGFLLFTSSVGIAAAAGDALATGDAIKQAIAGNTVQGSMSDASRYTEYYAADGTIKGDGYTGTWRVIKDEMCFKYGDDPENCWAVEVTGQEVAWVKDGKVDGTGTIMSGNPNNF